MPHKVRIALDAMGGDHGAAVVVPGAELSLERHPDIEFLLFGDRAELEPLLAARPKLKAASNLVHTDVVVQMHDKPSQALRKGRRRSSMWLAVDAVKKGEADVAVSAGNTGALMAMAKIDLRTMAGIERPAIAAIWPTLRGRSIVLDLGASIGADAAESGRYGRHGQRHGGSAIRSRPADGRAPQYRRGGGEGARGGPRGRADPARRPMAAVRVCRLRRGQRYRQGDGGRGGDRRVFRKYCAQGGRGHRTPARPIAQARD